MNNDESYSYFFQQSLDDQSSFELPQLEEQIVFLYMLMNYMDELDSDDEDFVVDDDILEEEQA